MKLRRVLVFALAALLLLTGVWIVGGNAWAARREEQCDKEWTAIFGSLENLGKKYPKRETNETAKKLEELTRGTSFDLTSSVRKRDSPPRSLPAVEAKRSQAIFDYVLAEITNGEAVVGAPPEDVARFFDEKRTQLDAIESILIGSSPPEWSIDLSRFEGESPVPNLLGHMRLQRILTARALAAAHGGRDELAAHSMEASWRLSESLRTRPENVSILIAMAGAHLQVGVLRKMNVEEHLWKQRLTSMDSRRSLLDTLVLDSRPRSSRTWWSNASKSDGDASWLGRARDFLERPRHRLLMAEYSEAMRVEFAHLRDAPLSDHFAEPSTPASGNLVQILLSIPMPNIKNSFVRADRLVVDAELTSKILEAKRLRRENGGRWPVSIPGIETSRFPGASWRYEVAPDGGRMSIAFSRELASPYGQNGMKPLPLRFSSN